MKKEKIEISEEFSEIVKKCAAEAEEISEDQLKNITGGAYGDNKDHQLDTVGTNGIEIIYKGTDTCPECGKTMNTYFYQQGDYFACCGCVYGGKYKK